MFKTDLGELRSYLLKSSTIHQNPFRSTLKGFYRTKDGDVLCQTAGYVIKLTNIDVSDFPKGSFFNVASGSIYENYHPYSCDPEERYSKIADPDPNFILSATRFNTINLMGKIQRLESSSVPNSVSALDKTRVIFGANDFKDAYPMIFSEIVDGIPIAKSRSGATFVANNDGPVKIPEIKLGQPYKISPNPQNIHSVAVIQKQGLVTAAFLTSPRCWNPDDTNLDDEAERNAHIRALQTGCDVPLDMREDTNNYKQFVDHPHFNFHLDARYLRDFLSLFMWGKYKSMTMLLPSPEITKASVFDITKGGSSGDVKIVDDNDRKVLMINPECNSPILEEYLFAYFVSEPSNDDDLGISILTGGLEHIMASAQNR